MREGYVIIQGYILEQKSLTPSEMIVCGLIDGFMKKHHTCDLSNEVIAELLHMEQASVAVHISNLYAKKAIINQGTKKNRKLKLNYEESQKTEIKESAQAEDVARFEEMWEREPAGKKEAKAEAKKYFMKLSQKNQESVISARAQYLGDMEDTTYAVLLRTFISQKRYEDERYQQKVKSKKEGKETSEFDIFVKKVLLLAKHPALKYLPFDEIKSENEGHFFSKREVECLISTVGDMRGLIEQAYDETNIRALLRTCW